jgi:hypothetical protein
MFSEIIEDSTLRGPAAVDLSSKALYINPVEWSKLSDKTRKFVLLHELAHLTGIIEESEADEFALNRFAESNEKLSYAINALEEGLTFTTQEEYDRFDNIIVEALRIEASRGNIEAQDVIEWINEDKAREYPAVLGWVEQIIGLLQTAGDTVTGDPDTYQISADGETVQVYDDAWKQMLQDFLDSSLDDAISDFSDGDFWGGMENLFLPGSAGYREYIENEKAIEKYEAQQAALKAKADQKSDIVSTATEGIQGVQDLEKIKKIYDSQKQANAIIDKEKKSIVLFAVVAVIAIIIIIL